MHVSPDGKAAHQLGNEPGAHTGYVIIELVSGRKIRAHSSNVSVTPLGVWLSDGTKTVGHYPAGAVVSIEDEPKDSQPAGEPPEGGSAEDEMNRRLAERYGG